MLFHHEGEFDGFGLSFGNEHGLRARQLRLIELEMCGRPAARCLMVSFPSTVISLCTLAAEDALPPRAGDFRPYWNEMASVRGQFQFATEYAEKLLQGCKRREMGPAFQPGDLRLFHPGEFRELGLTEPASFP